MIALLNLEVVCAKMMWCVGAILWCAYQPRAEEEELDTTRQSVRIDVNVTCRHHSKKPAESVCDQILRRHLALRNARKCQPKVCAIKC